MSFPHFRRLPPELRNKIWATIMPKLGSGYLIGEVKVTAKQVSIRAACQESRKESLRGHDKITFPFWNCSCDYINWSRDIIFLDIPEDCMNVDRMMETVGPFFRLMQLFAIRFRAYCFWDLPLFLAQASELQEIFFVNDPERFETWPLG